MLKSVDNRRSAGNTPARVLHIVSSLSTGSGILSALMSYYRRLDRNRLQFDFLSFRQADGTFEEEISALGGRVYRCVPPSARFSFWRDADGFFAAHEGEYPIVHCHPVFASAFFGPAAKRHGARHVIQHSHTTSYGGGPVSAVRNFCVELLFGRRATDFAACSQAAKKLFFWKPPEDIRLIYNAIDYDRFRFSPAARERIRGELGIGGNEIVLGHVGRFSREKNHSFLLRTFAQYRAERPDARLLMVGDGPLMADARRRAGALSIEPSVIFAGRRDNIEEYYAAMDIFLLPSRFEGLSIALLEAQASGLPCLVSGHVPGEAVIGGRVVFAPIDRGVKPWTERLAGIEPGDRRAPVRGRDDFDISRAVHGLEEYYFQLLRQ